MTQKKNKKTAGILLLLSLALILSSCSGKKEKNDTETEKSSSSETQNTGNSTENSGEGNASNAQKDTGNSDSTTDNNSAADTKKEVDFSKGLTAFQNSEYKFQMDFPTDWEKTDSVEEYGLSIASISENYDSIVVSVTEMTPEMTTVSDYQSTYADTTKINMGIDTLDSNDIININGTDFIKTTAQQTLGGEDSFTIISYMGFANNFSYEIVMTVDNQTYEKNKEIFTEIENSIQL